MFTFQTIWIFIKAYSVPFSWISSTAINGLLILLFIIRKKIGLIFNVLLGIFGAYLFFQVYYVRGRDTGDISFYTTLIVGYNLALLNRVVHSQLPGFFVVFSIEILYTIPKIVVTKDLRLDITLTHTLFVLSALLICFIDEKKDREIYGNLHQSKESLKKFQTLIEKYLPDAIIILDSENKNFVFKNNAYSEAFRTSLFQDPAITLEGIFVHRDPVRDSPTSETSLRTYLLRNFIEANAILYCTYRDHENVKKKYKVQIFPFMWDNQQTNILILSDMTAEETISRLKLEDELKDKAISVISHELRNPIGGVIGMLEKMKRFVKDAEIVKTVDICKANADYLLSLLNSILDVQQIRAGKIKIHKEFFNLSKAVSQLQPLFEFPCMQKNVKLAIYLDETLPKKIFSDKNRFMQVLINLVSNALKFTFKGSILLEIKPDDMNDSMIWVSVTDTGIGIKNEDRSRLFQTFGKLDQSQNINAQGVGLGLSISNDIVKQLNGSDEGIKLESEVDVGSKFYFFLRDCNKGGESSGSTPKSVPEEINEVHLIPVLETEKISMGKGKNRGLIKMKTDSKSLFKPKDSVLVVDDNPFNIIVVKSLIEDRGLHAILANHGQEAINVVLENKYTIKLILMDCEMPVMDGFEATKILREKMENGEIPNIPIYALSANSLESEIQKCLRTGMEGHIVKPLKESELKKLTKKHGLS